MNSTCIRYVLGRVKHPKPPAVLKSGKISTSKNQDTTAKLYLETCSERDCPPDNDLYQHLAERDKTAWLYSTDFPVLYVEAKNMAQEIGAIAARRMRQEKAVPPRNPWACHNPNCDWLELCHSDPTGNVDEWWGIKTSDYSGLKNFKIQTANGVWKELSRDKPGVVVSPSEVRCYLDCPRKWHFEYVKKARRFDLPYSRYSARFKGTLAHHAAEMVGRYTIEHDQFPSLSDIFDPYWKHAQKLISEFDNTCIKEEANTDADAAFGVGYRMAELALEDANKILHIEQRFAVVIPGTKTWLTCQPDIVTETPEGICITDYKTTSKIKLDQVAEGYRYNPALFLYALAIEDGRPVKEN